MKRLIILLLFLFTRFSAHSQQCHPTISSDVLIPNVAKIPHVTTGNVPVDSKLKSILNCKFLTGISESDLQQSVDNFRGITEVGYEINYNSHCILSITVIEKNTGAYEWIIENNYNININTGDLIALSNIFTPGGKLLLQHKCDSMLQTTLKKMKSENSDSTIISIINKMKFQAHDLESFKVTPAGVTFRYDFGFPPMYNMESYMEFNISFNECKTLINSTGPFNFLK